MVRCWVVGPVAWDRVLRVEELPAPGESPAATSGSERPGGSGFNVACGLASVPLEVSLVGYCGSDEPGDKIVRVLQRWGVDLSFLQRLELPTPQTTVLITAEGDQRVKVDSSDLLAMVRLPSAAAQRGDVVYFAVWDDRFASAAAEYLRNGAIVVASTGAANGCPDAHYVVGAVSDLPDSAAGAPFDYLRTIHPSLKCAFLWGSGKAAAYSDGATVEEADFEVTPLDPVGAADAFAAGIVLGVSEGVSPQVALSYAQRWRAAASGIPASIPPKWANVGVDST